MLDRPIRNYMTRSPVLIGRRQTLATAHALMRARKIRHLPVLESGKLVGVVSLGDLHFIESLRDVEPDEVLVEEAMSTDPYVVTGATSLASVARTMARRKLGSAVIVDDGVVVGVFTAVDGLRVLARLAAQVPAVVPAARRTAPAARPAAPAAVEPARRRAARARARG